MRSFFTRRVVLFLLIPMLLLSVLSAVLGILLHREKADADALAVMLTNVTQGRSPSGAYEPVTVDHHYELAGHKIFLQDTVYGQIWLPVLADVPLSTHPNERLKPIADSDRMMSYDTDGNANALTGIDLSAHNTVTDWAAVKADGIAFVMLRIGYRTYGGGQINADAKFLEHYNGAKAAGLKVGAYFFSQAISEEEAAEEAIFTANLLEGLTLDYPVAFDWEIIFDDAEGARTDAVTVDTLTNCTLTFCQNIKAFGYEPMIYQNKRTALLKYDLPRLRDYPFWLAEYGDGPTYIYDYAMWQYSCKGTVAGIAGEVDLNLSFYDYAQAGNPAVMIPTTTKSQEDTP